MEWVRDIIESETEGMSPDEIRVWADDLECGGCVSGMVGDLVYYSQTREVYEANENEILRALSEFGYTEEPCQEFGSLANARVWAAFDLDGPDLARELADKREEEERESAEDQAPGDVWARFMGAQTPAEWVRLSVGRDEDPTEFSEVLKGEPDHLADVWASKLTEHLEAHNAD